MKTPSSWRRKPKHKSLKIAKGELWKFILRNDFSFWKPRPANWFYGSCTSRSLSASSSSSCCFPSSSIKKFHKTHSHFYKNTSTAAPSDPLFLLSLCLSLSCIATINLYFVFACVRRACVCLRCLAVVCRCVECARGLVRACSREPKRKEEKSQRERERERERERKFTEITYVISA